MKRKDWKNLAGTVMWFFAGMALWGYALTLMERREEKQAREGHFPLESDDIRRYSIAIFAGILTDILLGASLIAWLETR